MRKRNLTLSIWIGLFAMLMIHVGPLYSAVQAAQPTPAIIGAHDGHAHLGEPLHHSLSSDGPAWLSALKSCGYCDLLTLNPPLVLSVDLALPPHAPGYVQPLPQQPLRPALRRSGGYPRAPPYFHS